MKTTSKKKFLIFFLGALFKVTALAYTLVNTLVAGTVEAKNIEKESPHFYSMLLEKTYENSNNTTQDPDTPIAGRYFLLQVNATGNFMINSRFWGVLLVNAHLKKYDEKRLDNNLKNKTLEVGTGLIYFYHQYDMSFEVAKFFEKGRQIDYINNTEDGLDRKGQQIEAGVNGGLDLEKGRFEVNFGHGINKAQTINFDENRNQFYDNYKTFELNAFLQKKIAELYQIKGIFTYQNILYSEKTAKYSNGAIDNNRLNPLEEIDEYGLELTHIFDVEGVIFTFGHDYLHTKDVVFGALSAYKYSLNFGMKIPFYEKLLFGSNYSYSKKRYKNFVADVFDRPNNFILRKDDHKSFSLGVEYGFKYFTPKIKYLSSIVKSNHPFTSFKEKIFSLGVKFEIL